MTAGPEVRLAGVSAGYRRLLRRRRALHDVGWTASPGSITALVGPNGSGKTTTFRLLMGVLAPLAGEVSVGGRSPTAHRRAEGTGYLPEERVRLPGWTVSGLLALAGATPEERGVPAPLAALARRPVDSLSRGEARSVLMAFALAGDPKLLLLDEPWSGLDLEARRALGARLDGLREAGRTVLVSSHELLEVVRLADRIVAMAAGRVTGVVEARGRPADAVEADVRALAP